MSTTTEYIIDTSINISEDSIRLTQERKFCADTLMELYHSNRIPQTGSRHSEDVRLRLVSAQIGEIGNVGGTKQFLWTGEYECSYKSSSSQDAVDKNPWQLDAQKFNVNSYTFQESWKEAFDEKGDIVPLLNSANCPLNLNHDVYAEEITFVFATRNEPHTNEQPVINASTVIVAGREIPQYAGLLMPLLKKPVVEYDNLGHFKRRYWEVSAKIRIKSVGTWQREVLDVSTLAFDPDNPDDKIPVQLYKYKPWTSIKEDEKLKTPQTIGTLGQLCRAREEYAKIVMEERHGLKNWENELNDTKKSQNYQLYYQAMKEFEFSAVNDSDPAPLTAEGFVDMEAVRNPELHPHRKLYFYEYPVGSWNQYNMPKKVEGM